MLRLRVSCVVPIAAASVSLSSLLVASVFAAPPQTATPTPRVPSAPVNASTRIYDSPSALRKEDSRLEKRVSVDKPFVYLGELLESVSVQSGVSVAASDADGAAGEEMTAVLSDMPLADVMENLTALLSHRGAKWQWRREGDGSGQKPFVYRLLRPANSVGEYTEAMKAQMQADFEKDAEIMLAGLDMTDEEIRQKAKQHPHLAYYLRPGGSTRLGVEALRDGFSAEERQRLLRGETWKSVPLKDLPPPGVKLKDFMLGKFQAGNPGREFKIDAATFSVGVDDAGVPSLWIGFGDLGAWTYLGSKTLSEATLAKASKDWTHEGEEATDPLEAQTLPKGKATEADGNRNRHLPRFQYIAKAGNVSLLTRLAREGDTGSSLEPWDMPLGAYLSDIASNRGLTRKWRKTSDGKPVLLIEFNGWHLQDADPEKPRLPWEVVKRLRAGRDKNTNESLLTETLSAVTSLNEEQMKRLHKGEFPVLLNAQLESGHWFGSFATWVMEKPTRLAQVTSPEGVALGELPFDKKFMIPFANRETATRVRVAVSGDNAAPVAYQVELLDKDGAATPIFKSPGWSAKSQF